MNMKALWLGAALIMAASSAQAQSGCSGQPTTGFVCGNGQATTGLPGFYSQSTLLDRGFGSGQGTILNRGVSGWVATVAPTLGLNGGTGGSITLNGATSGAAAITVPSVAGSVLFQLPGTNGANNQVLTTDGSGHLSWVTLSGTGTVTSVGLALPGIFTVSGSPITSNGTLTGSLATQAANSIWAGPTTGAAATPTFRALVGADLPNPSTSVLGGVRAINAVTSNWVNSISTSGIPQLSQPSFADISGSIAPTQCPASQLAALGCVNAINATASQWLRSLSTAGAFTSSQPTFADIAGSVMLAQLPSISNNSVLGNNSGGTAIPSALSASNVLDMLGTTQGGILYRNASTWVPLTPGTSGQVLQTNGAAANPSWVTVAGTGTVTNVATGSGLTGGPITTTGTVSLASIATGNVLANVSGGSAAPSANTPSSVLDVIGSSTGSILYRAAGGTGWQALAAGTNGQVLTMGASTPAWNSAGSVTNVTITAGQGLTSSGTCNISSTGTCTLVTAPGVQTNTRLAKSAAYTAVTADCNSTLALGGGAFYAATFNAPSGYPATCSIYVFNEDTTRGKLLLPQFASSTTSNTIGTGSKAFTTAAGLTVSTTERYRVYSLANTANWMAGTATYSGTTFTLTVDTVGGSGTFTDWQIAPEIQMARGDKRLLFAQNNVWHLSPKIRWLTPGRGNVYELCVVQNGSDSNDGFGTGGASDCLANIQTAINRIGTDWDGGGYNACSVGLYAGGTSTFAPSTQTGQSVGCYLTYNVRGTVKITGAGSCFSNGDNAISIWNWNLTFVPTFACNTGNAASTGQFKGHQTSIFDFNGGTAIWIPGGITGLGTGGTKGTNDMFFDVDLQGSATHNAQVNIGNGTDTFNPLTFVFCEAHCSKVTLSGTIAFNPLVTMGVALVLRAGSVINTTLTWSGATITSAITVTGNSVLIYNGTTIPPSTPITATGGQACSTIC